MNERYVTKEMANLWSDEHKFLTYLEVEVLVCQAWYRLGVIPKEDWLNIAQLKSVDVKRIKEIEELTRHDVIAFTRYLSEQLANEKKWIHYGLTSSDVVDTAYGFLYRQANQLIEKALVDLLQIIKDMAIKYKYTPQIGRTHGIHGELTTFGLKFALYYDQGRRHLAQFKAAAKNIEVGKISGAVGTFATVDSRVQDMVCQELGIGSVAISNQILSRDRHAHYFSVLALIGSFLEKIAVEIRHLQRTEVSEVREGFMASQKGSSAMPHKRNPIGSENISGLARILRGYMLSAYEDIALWHERDISHSSVERIISGDGTSLIEYMLIRMTNIIGDLEVDTGQMLRNINLTNGLIFSQNIVLKLIDKGKSREEAYDFVQKQAFIAWQDKCSFKDLIGQQGFIQEYLNEEELADCFDLSKPLKAVDEIFERVGI